jgi:hypothetical protein
MLIHGNVPKTLWTEAALSAICLLNQSPTKANPGLTPEERLYSVKPDLSQTIIFGCLAYIHIRKELRDILEPTSAIGIYLGEDENSKGFRIYRPNIKKVIITKDVIFDESKTYKANSVETTFDFAALSPLFSQPLTKDAESTSTGSRQVPKGRPLPVHSLF